MQHLKKVCSCSLAVVPPSHEFTPVRRAYRRQALQTHPDRAPASEKALAEEKFRQVGTISVPHNSRPSTNLTPGQQRLPDLD